jgi:hypothetical protein
MTAMANPEHLEILKRGVEAWNEWRQNNPTIRPELSKAYLSSRALNEVDFSDANMERANLYEANLCRANLHRADLNRADLRGANLRETDLRDTNLSSVDLTSTNLSFAKLKGTDLSSAIISLTVFGYTDLSDAKGLETCGHYAQSVLDHGTIQISGKLPLRFYRGCGLPDVLIEYLPSVLLNNPIQFHSCFISYSSKNNDFAERLYADLQAKGVRVWFAPHDLSIGARIRAAIDESIRVHDKLLLVLSETSVSSQWVEQEVETALARERESEGKPVLFPIRIDDSMMEIKSGWPALLKNTRNVGDFTKWKEHDSYAKAFERLLRDLKAGGEL